MPAAIDRLIITSPYEEPSEHWSFDHQTSSFERKKGRRKAGYMRASANANPLNDPGRFLEIELVNKIRPRINAWRTAGYPGVTGITKYLLEHWRAPSGETGRRFFFCQLEAIETLIFLTEADSAEHVGLAIKNDGSSYPRYCSKMATGTGKTTVISMVIAWQILNKVAYPKDTRFSKTALVMVPGRTVRSRLSVLDLDAEGNYYDAFNVVPTSLRENLRQGAVIVRNWQSMQWDSPELVAARKGVDKRGPLTDESYVRRVLGGSAKKSDIFVINDEAHHAWRVSGKTKGIAKEAVEEATRWMAALDRIHQARRIVKAYDFSATPFAPTGGRAAEDSLYTWIVSDFGLNDAIEAGLVKTPRIVVRDSGKVKAKTYRSQLYHIYNNEEVRADLNRPAESTEPLPSLVQNAYALLAQDWSDTSKLWKAHGMRIPPVMISVVNRTETAARVKSFFERNKVEAVELCSPENTVQIDSSVLANLGEELEAMANDAAEDESKTLTKKQVAAYLRAKVNTVGQIGKPGEMVCNLISVGMLTEGWDTKTVTHIMGLRAFSSQLLCEQVVGRGLRRTAYEIDPATGLFEPEYVNVFGIPFTYLPVEGDEKTKAEPPKPKLPVYADSQKKRFEIQWPRILRVQRHYRSVLSFSLSQARPLHLKVAELIQSVDLAPTVDGKTDVRQVTQILLQSSGDRRLQTVLFESARDVFEVMKKTWLGDSHELMAQLLQLTAMFMKSGPVSFEPELGAVDTERKELLLMFYMPKIVQHVAEQINHENTIDLTPIFDQIDPVGTTENASSWYTARPCEAMVKTHMNFCVFDSAWEKAAAQVLDNADIVEAWVKNDHLNFDIFYLYDGASHKYRPDFLVRLANNTHVILEIKGQPTEKDQAKWASADEWVQAINADGSFGTWARLVSTDETGGDLVGKLKQLQSKEKRS